MCARYSRMKTRAVMAGVGMVPFAKPGQSEPYDVMGARAARAALADAGIGYGRVQQAYAGYVYGDCLQRPGGAVSRRHDRRTDRQRE